MLDPGQMIAYVSALGIAAIIPGPGMTALVAHSVRGGATAGFTMLTGLIFGDMIYLFFAVFGLSIITNTYEGFFTIVTWCSAVYLLWLSWQFWSYRPEEIDIDKKMDSKELASAWVSGLTITLGNPKTIAFYLAILPLVLTMDTVSIGSWGLFLVPLTIAVLAIIGSIFIFGAIKIRKLLASSHAQEVVFKCAGGIMLAAATSMVYRTL